jgi:EAL domain-containing protein (putative c-di-GMP-specific phosphodiesterase class I)
MGSITGRSRGEHPGLSRISRRLASSRSLIVSSTVWASRSIGRTAMLVNFSRALSRSALSLDDFGTGWSSLSCLRRFPLDRIKIDRSFMRDITTQPAAEAVVTSIIDLARNLGLTCVAEGVETIEQLDYLEKKHCAEIQGFLYSPALPASDCGALMRSGKPDFLILPNVIVDEIRDEVMQVFVDRTAIN